jgi:hypothetical protein
VKYNGYRYFNDSEINGLAGQFGAIQNVEASGALLRTSCIMDNVSDLSNPRSPSQG